MSHHLILLLLLIMYMNIVNCFDIKNQKVIKSINLRSQIIKHKEEINFVNVGSENLNLYTYVLDPNIKKVHIEFTDKNEVILPFVKESEHMFTVNLSSPLEPWEESFINVYSLVLDELKIVNSGLPYRVINYKGNLLCYSPFVTDICIVMFLANEKYEFIEMEPRISGNRTNMYYSSSNISAYAYEEFHLIFVNDNPFYVITRLDRKIDVSHFGFITVEDEIEVVNHGPKTKYPYKNFPSSARKSLFTYLPASAFDIKLFDEIGNNSKSEYTTTDNGVLLSFEARYDLMMSWKTIYILQYTVPAYEYLRRLNDMYILNMRVVDYTLPEAMVKFARTRIVLPSDSEVIYVNCTDSHVEEDEMEITTTHLSPSRPVVVFLSKELMDGLIPDFYIKYTRCPIMTFKPTFYIFVYIEAFFVIYLFTSYTKPMLSLK